MGDHLMKTITKAMYDAMQQDVIHAIMMDCFTTAQLAEILAAVLARTNRLRSVGQIAEWANAPEQPSWLREHLHIDIDDGGPNDQ
jgi:hypothetical protein